MDLVHRIAIVLPRVRDAAHPGEGCTIETCPVSLSVYGYLPSKAVNLAFLAIFALSFVAHVFQGIRCKAWGFVVALGIGTLLEVVGYLGRVQMHKDPFKRGPLAINIVCLTVAPAFMAAGVYLTLKHLVIILGPEHSRFAPKWYTRIFIFCDIVSILIQTAGSTLSTKGNLVDTANGIMEAGIATQVLTLLIFGGLAAEFYLRYKKAATTSAFQSQTQTLAYQQQANEGIPSTHIIANIGLEKRVTAVVISYFAILIRCIYRIAEMAGGWRNPVMQNQVVFVVLDGVMCVIGCVVLNIFHPGAIFQKSKILMANGRVPDGNMRTSSMGPTHLELQIVPGAKG
ncbi:hypothetical protein BP6252_13147 [Coleophoma cylindrospora]|uniref:RTA1-domain-containing protein n=1 Tax=Coleophoma cylindrospora TaxID=1849047 RepID=A0A3D8QA74_9HELO|nr:hypothetical protein BP6252_13147 [Coleophoma cylindrospora]